MSLEEINAAQQLMKIAINSQNHVDSLVGFYRDLIDSYNNQRSQWILHYNFMNTSAEDQHILQQQLGHAQAQISDLQQDLALKKAQLTAQRQRYFKLLENNGNIKKRLEQSKTNYRELMNTCKPVGLNNKQLNSSSLNVSKQQQSKLSVLKQGANPKAVQLQLELINTVKEHTQKKKKMKQKIDLLKQELSSIISEYQNRQQQKNNDYEDALGKLCDLQKKHMALTTEYFRFRTENSAQQKKLQEQNQIIRLKNLAIVQRLKNLQKSHSDQFKTVDNQVKKQNKKFKIKYDEQLRKKEEHLKILKEQHERIQDIYLNKIKKLDQQLKSTNEKLKTTQQKSRVEVSSLRSQIKILKSRLQKEGLHQIRKQMADENDESSQSLEISDLQKINQQVKNLQRQINSGK